MLPTSGFDILNVFATGNVLMLPDHTDLGSVAPFKSLCTLGQMVSKKLCCPGMLNGLAPVIKYLFPKKRFSGVLVLWLSFLLVLVNQLKLIKQLSYSSYFSYHED